ncbi:Eco57I restriction-modification methylase domain-containing protein [Clostridium algidicarnis]|uniref:Eco57I restriction-modification methylase domain-containing protein n=1 Tax=Clostridium algidicarnis TaxID=37659 RepID=UPI001C0B749A|nr:N-6 DNA methylase [Clostridium algidicarnis]MBU3202755.1 N-6 DNA methylase [Clostridium algidicarnis]MBU3210909.1 N-6 DNA methylase [Clostridium algidicarnis]MBU3222583.1 N-6 DNA methylase [Clostridium algidicarnis]
MNRSLNLNDLKNNFRSNRFNNEDDIKVNFHTDIVKPILRAVNPLQASQYNSENRLLSGGIPDATFQNISFEYKKYGHFDSIKGIEEALYGRKQGKTDHGLYDYIISDSEIKSDDNEDIITEKITNNIGVGFDGKQFIFARFIKTTSKNKIDTTKTNLESLPEIKVEFQSEIKNFDTGIRKLTLLLRQQNKMALTKKNLLGIINTESPFVRESIQSIYKELEYNITTLDGSGRVRTLYSEWDRVFGVMYGEDDEATGFTEVTPSIREAYGFEDDFEIDSKMYLFALQTFFNIVLKLLVHSFLSQLISPSFTAKDALTKAQVDMLFDGNNDEDNKIVDNFFESHFLEWFTYSDRGFEVDIVNKTLELISNFDLGTFVLKPEEVQDILQEVYMELIPIEMRHLMGEYFSPDWIVEHALDMVSYDGDISKTLVDPTSGSGTFLTQALKRIIKKKDGKIVKGDIEKIIDNLVGFDINPISVVAAKANFILILFSAFFDEFEEDFGEPVSIPIYIADSILSPVVYSEENDDTLVIDTSAGKFEIPKFSKYKEASEFLKILSGRIHEKPNFERFWIQVKQKGLVKDGDHKVVKKLFDNLYTLHRSGKDSFWPIILRNSFAPIMIGNKFDYVVGNPPWISWKSMSKSYREGTLKVWQSYGIFEKSAYDKKTTHDDFGMAVTYVAVDQYLKVGGEMIFLLPASFLKSTKGGEGFRKLSIIRNDQNIPFSIENVDDFSNVRLFTVPTVAVRFNKGNPMKYPLDKYRIWTQTGRKIQIPSHDKWSDVSLRLTHEDLYAQPVDSSDIQSAWLTLPNMDFANHVLDQSKPRVYRGRKGIEPAGAKGIYILKKPQRTDKGFLRIENDISRQKRKDLLEKGIQKGVIEETFIYPMLGGRNLQRWGVKSNEFILVPHSIEHKYGIPEDKLQEIAPKTIEWLDYYYDGLLASRIQNGKFYNPETQPYYRLDNIGDYTYAPYKVLWKEQTGSMAAVTVGSYYESVPDADRSLFSEDKTIVVDSKVLMLGLDNELEAYYVTGILNSPNIRTVIDGYAISTNRGVDVLKYLAIPEYNIDDILHKKVASISKDIHLEMKKNKVDLERVKELEVELNTLMFDLF